MKLEVGMYVRLIRANRTYIRKINSIYEIYSKNKKERLLILDKSFDGCRYSIRESKIIKASYNIIDLIEVGDYVNGHKVILVNTTFTYASVNVETSGEATCEVIPKKDIKSIVTHEQFESMKYEVE